MHYLTYASRFLNNLLTYINNLLAYTSRFPAALPRAVRFCKVAMVSLLAEQPSWSAPFT